MDDIGGDSVGLGGDSAGIIEDRLDDVADDDNDDTPSPSYIFLGDDIEGNDRYPSVSDDVEISHPDFALRDAAEG